MVNSFFGDAGDSPDMPSVRPKQPSLAAALIVRDEARCIARCLASVRPWVDRIVVLDTGSTDDTVGVAKSCGAEVHHLDWPNDFSAARNRLLDIADADWTLMIDADEWIDAGGKALRDWSAGPQRLGIVRIDSAFDRPLEQTLDAAQSSRSWVTRLLPRGARYEGRVHEQVASSLPRERIAVHLGHDGYRDAQLAGKSDRNRPLLLLDLADRPDDPYILFQLGKDAGVRSDHVSACDWYARSHARTPLIANWRHELVVAYLHSLSQAGRVDAALGVADGEFPHWQDSPDFFFVLGNLLLDRAIADPAQAMAQWLPLAQSAWERCLTIGERPDLEGSTAGRGSHLAAQNLAAIRSQVSAAA